MESSPATMAQNGFDFTLHIRRLCEDFVARLEPLRHIDLTRVAISFSQTRSAARQGLYATLTPLRFFGGKLHTIRRGRQWGIQKVHDGNGREMLYLLNFYLPRFLDLSFREKLTTVVHELWHIHPQCNGDVRRLGAERFVHGRSKRQYDAQMEKLVEDWLAQDPPGELYDFLRQNFRELSARRGRVFGRKFHAPKLFRVD
jgi:predicted metallopeptidase